MNSVRAIQQLNKRELEAGISPAGSWHTDYRDTAFIYIGGLPFELSEGDIITICSQFGEPVWIKLARDKETGKSRGFAWVKYEDQRSCDLAVDNLGGATIMDRIIRVDHARYKPKDDEDMRDNTMGELDLDPGNETDEGRRKRQKTESDSDEDRPLLPEEVELERLREKLDEEDPMRDFMIKAQQEKVSEALKKFKKNQRKEKDRERRKHRHRHRDRSRDGERDRGQKAIKDYKDAHEDGRSEHQTRRRKSRSRSQDDHSDEDRRKRDRRDDRRHRQKEARDRGRERRSPSVVDEDQDQERPRPKRSPIPYRARSPRRTREASRSRTPPSRPGARRSRS